MRTVWATLRDTLVRETPFARGGTGALDRSYEEIPDDLSEVPAFKERSSHGGRGPLPQARGVAGPQAARPPPAGHRDRRQPDRRLPASAGALVAELQAYRAAGGRVALISQEGLPFPTVPVDDYGGARALARTLADLSLRRFAVVHSGDRIRTSADRRHGFTDGLLSAGLAPPALVETDFSRAGGRRAGALIPPDTDAVFAVNDIMAVGSMTGLRAAGRSPSHDIAVAGFDDVEEARYATPPLTTAA
ncbi:hypothetical protein J2S43_003779 [Catenuloplanes nepalensis]|uniref:Transcriptional regulator LacI/GalR-like sensor domain-containing protein n=1 Tax=Catenuloplanes nepalensis TaxID=587533 RepID=A0ABT9MV00_9ACTN|nr:substrate-binding domain-containing protein [Catenuloplanes nepalensis]MDP9795267.1 hypothetical protein [Catenuloplanes nepalensis]